MSDDENDDVKMNELDVKRPRRMMVPTKVNNVRIEVWQGTKDTKLYEPRVDGKRIVKIDPEEVCNLAFAGLEPKRIAAFYGVKIEDFYDACVDYPDLMDAWEQGRAKGVAYATQKLMEHMEKNISAPMFYLKTKDGWVEEQFKKENATNSNVSVQVYLPENNRDTPTEEEDETNE